MIIRDGLVSCKHGVLLYGNKCLTCEKDGVEKAMIKNLEIQIDASKLADLIIESVSDLDCGYHEEETTLIGEYKGMQIHLTVTRYEMNLIGLTDNGLSNLVKINKVECNATT